jgi:hypothetical protein
MSSKGPFVKGLVPQAALLEDGRAFRMWVLVGVLGVWGFALERGLWNPSHFLFLFVSWLMR